MKILIDGVETEIRYISSDHLGWRSYNTIKNGVPTSEISLPPGVNYDSAFSFRTGGHEFKSLPRKE